MEQTLATKLREMAFQKVSTASCWRCVLTIGMDGWTPANARSLAAAISAQSSIPLALLLQLMLQFGRSLTLANCIAR